MFQSPDGDLIDCVASHRQPAFDHPLLKGQKPLVSYFSPSCQIPRQMDERTISVYKRTLQDPPERPKGHGHHGMIMENFQLWSASGESCPEGTVPIRRTTKRDMLRASSVSRFGRKVARHVRRDTSSNGHEVRNWSILLPFTISPEHPNLSLARALLSTAVIMIAVYRLACGRVRDRRPVLRGEGEHKRVGAMGLEPVRVQPLADVGHLRLVRQRSQHHRGWLAGKSNRIPSIS